MVALRKRKGGGSPVIPLDAEETLFETSSREVWQSTLVTMDGIEVGPVVRQVIEPRMYTIRYLIVYDVRRERHVLHPSNAIEEIEDRCVHSSLSGKEIESMPPFLHTLSRPYEQAIYECLGRTPYWQEESALNQDE